MHPDLIFEHVLSQIQSLRKTQSSELRLLLSISGGVDSMVLLEILYLISISNLSFADLQIGVFHLEHGIRKDAGEDYQLVMNYCKKRNIPFYGHHMNMPKMATQKGLSLETVSRNMRYNLLFLEYESGNYDYVLTAHHSDDNAESIFMNMARGAGLRGLCGMFSKRGRMIRPLLECSKNEILEYAHKQGISYREDSTNFENEYSRNKIRNLIFPYLNDVLGVNFSEKLLHSSRLLKYEFEENKRRVDGFVEQNFKFYKLEWEKSEDTTKRIFPEEIDAGEYLKRFFHEDAMHHPYGLRFLNQRIYDTRNIALLLNRKKYCDEDYTIRSQVLYDVFEWYNFNKADVDTLNIQMIDDFIQNAQSGKHRVYKSVMFEISSDQVFIVNENDYLEYIKPYSMTLKPGKNLIPNSNYALIVEILSNQEAKYAFSEQDNKDVLLLDANFFDNILLGEIQLRNRCEHDVISPIDMPDATKKIKKIMNELKLNSVQKRLQPLLCIENNVLWLIGKRKSKYHIFNSNLEKILKIKLVIVK